MVDKVKGGKAAQNITKASNDTGNETKAPDTGNETKSTEPKMKNEMFYSKARERTDQDKLPKQASEITTLIHGADKEIARTQLIEKMQGVVQTKQPLERILSYYQAKLIQMGLIKVDRRAIPEIPVDAKAA